MTDRYERPRASAHAEGCWPWVPEGWKLVPVEPTRDMRAAARQAWVMDPMQLAATMWRAMLAAAPSPEVQPAEQRAVDVGALRKLAAKWRSMRREYYGSAADVIYACANELESLLTAGDSDSDR